MQMNATTLEDSFHSLFHQFQTAAPSEIVVNKFRGEIILSMFNITISADSHQVQNLTLEQLGYSPAKINHLLRNYVDPAELKSWLKHIVESLKLYGGVDSDVLLPTIRDSKHTRGPCLLGFSFRTLGGWTLTVYSRSADLPQMFGADVLLASALADLIKDLCPGAPEDIKVKWYIASARVRGWRANYYRIHRILDGSDRQRPMVFDHTEFQAYITKSWDKYIAGDYPASFGKLKALKKFYDAARKHTLHLEHRTSVGSFKLRLLELMGV